MNNRRILIIPDACVGTSSGATVTQVMMRWLKQADFTVSVYSADVKATYSDEDVEFYPAPCFTGYANIFSSEYRKRFKNVLDTFMPSHILFVGSITNKPLCYLEEAYKRNLKVEVFIFMQDFYCSKYYANDHQAPCRKCLDEGFKHVFKSNCGVKDIGFLKLAERYRTRIKLQKLLTKVDHIGTSTDEQAQFYVDFGIQMSKIFKLPLPFDDSKLKKYQSSRGDYYIGIAQNRIEKGFQFVPSILEHTSAKLILAYYNEQAVSVNLQNPEFRKYIEKGQLRLVASSWKTNLGDLVAGSLGVLIPTIWPTTTEYGWLEALALNKPTVTFDISAHHEFMSNRLNGLVSPLGDFKAMGENMDYLMSVSDSVYHDMERNIEKLYATLSNQNGWLKFFTTL